MHNWAIYGYPSDHTLLHYPIIPSPQGSHPLPEPCFPLSTPYYPISRRTTPFTCTLHPHYPIPRRTTPFVGTPCPSDHNLLPHPHNKHTHCWYPHPSDHTLLPHLTGPIQLSCRKMRIYDFAVLAQKTHLIIIGHHRNHFHIFPMVIVCILLSAYGLPCTLADKKWGHTF